MLDQHTIIDEVKIARDRTVFVRLAIVVLENGELALDPSGQERNLLYHRFGILPGMNSEELVAVVNESMNRDLGLPPLPKADFLHELMPVIHTPEIVEAHREVFMTAFRIRKNARPNEPQFEPAVRHEILPIRTQALLKLASGEALGSPDDRGIQQTSIVNEVRITRSRTVLTQFGLVEVKNGRECFNWWNNGTVKPGQPPKDLVDITRSGLQKLGHPVLTSRGENLLTATPGAVHSSPQVALYNQLRTAQFEKVLADYRKTDQTSSPRVPLELSKRDALRVAMET